MNSGSPVEVRSAPTSSSPATPRPIAFIARKDGICTKGATVHVAIAASALVHTSGRGWPREGIRVTLFNPSLRHHVNATMPRSAAGLSPTLTQHPG